MYVFLCPDTFLRRKFYDRARVFPLFGDPENSQKSGSAFVFLREREKSGLIIEPFLLPQSRKKVFFFIRNRIALGRASAIINAERMLPIQDRTTEGRLTSWQPNMYALRTNFDSCVSPCSSRDRPGSPGSRRCAATITAAARRCGTRWSFWKRRA